MGTSLAARHRAGVRGRDTQTGEALLDFSDLAEAIAEGRGHRIWILTTYQTLTNYQHSLGQIAFSTAVFDEIQNVKNPASLRALAAMAVNADFRIGLTGTPIENSTVDLWAIMEQLVPGALGTLTEFRQRYGDTADGNENSLRALHAQLFTAQDGLPPIALRRLKEEVASDLPPKSRLLHPREMPEQQAVAYELARMRLKAGGRGSALKLLHHIRSVSVHPSADLMIDDSDYIALSARLQAVFDVLQQVRAQRERALVFIEHVKMQHRFIALARRAFDLPQIDLINGSTPIPQRRAIVDRFQASLEHDSGFGMLVLGPKAAGTGLTLTAATHVIHLSRWWNPAVEEQCNDRVHRIGQTRPVNVHVPMAVHPSYQHESFDCLLHSLTTRKRRLATSTLWPLGDTGQDVRVLRTALADAAGTQTNDDPVSAAMQQLFARDGLDLPPPRPDGSIPIT